MNKILTIFVWLLCSSGSKAQVLQLCGTNPVLVAQLSATTGVVPNTAKQQAWLYWQVAQSGSIAFTLYPLSPIDDLDFVLYRKSGEQWQALRTMQSGQLYGASNETSHDCMGPCGLHHSASDLAEVSGCSLRQDNFLATIQGYTGEEYALVVSNYKGTNGFWWEYQGSADLAAPNTKASNILRSDNVFTSKAVTNPVLVSIENIRQSKPYQTYFERGMAAATIYESKNIAGCATELVLGSNTLQPSVLGALDFIGEPQPNPSHSEAQLSLVFVSATDLKYTILESNGALVEQQQVHFEAGKNQLAINTSNWPAATYMIVLSHGESITTKIIIKE